MRAVTMLAALLALALTAAAAPSTLRAQETAARFEIGEVLDSTFTFDVGRQGWVAPRMQGIAVDPRRRDALVARFRVLSVTDGMATALITGETTRLTTQHVALLEPPRRAWWKNALFWGGTALGAAVGFTLGKL